MKEEKVIEKKKNKLPIIIGGILVVVIATIIFVVINATGSKDKKVKEKLELAAQYLTNMDYEKAIATYEEAIKIDPKSADAYCGLADTYIAMADNSIKEGDIDKANEYYDMAIHTLEEGINNVSETDREKLNIKLQNLRNELTNKKNQNTEYEEDNGAGLSSVSVGDTIYYGHKNDKNLSWRVLDVQDGKALLLADSIEKVKLKDIDDFNYEEFFTDDELKNILITEIIDTNNNIPEKAYDKQGKDSIEYKFGKEIIFKQNCREGSDSSNYIIDDTSPEFIRYEISIRELNDSDYDGEKKSFFFLSYDEAEKYNIKDIPLRNIMVGKFLEYNNPTTICNSKRLKNLEKCEYDSEYGYMVVEYYYEEYTSIDKDGEFVTYFKKSTSTFTNADVDGELFVNVIDEPIDAEIDLRPAMWVKIN